MAVLPYLYLIDVLRLVCTCKTLVKTIDQPKYFTNFFLTKLSLIPRVQEPNRLVHYLIRVGYDLKQTILSMMNVLYVPDTYPVLEMFDVLRLVHNFSSQDRPNELASNLLTKSNCYHRFEYFRPSINELHVHILGLREQMRCGCSANRPCYWSSAPQHEATAIEHITFTLFSPLVMIHSFSVTPYQAFFHPEAPVYSPVSVTLQFLAPILDGDNTNEIIDDNNNELDFLSNNFYCYHETDEFQIEPLFKAQVFTMSSPILAVGGRVRMMLRGSHQRQTLEGETDNGMPLDEYYMCLSEVSLYGIVIATNDAEELLMVQKMDQAEKERMAIATGEKDVFTKFKTWLR